MIKVEFKEPVRGMTSTICNSISVDPMDETIFLIQFSPTMTVWETPLSNIKYVKSHQTTNI